MLLTFAMILDAAFGEPKWLWSRATHPAVIMGHWIKAADLRWNQGSHRRIKGALVMSGLVIFGALVPALVLQLISTIFGHALAGGIELLLVAILLAQRSLVDHVMEVKIALGTSLAAGRAAVGKIVGRDTAQMSQAEVIRAAIESAAENLSDAVVAPIFWYLIGGLPGILAYKIINTADSMIGYKTERYHAFGWAAARIDDAMNWVPARMTGFIILALSSQTRLWRSVAQTAKKHRSVNAGWPEAAIAFALDISLAGPRRYQGELHDEPYVHPKGRKHPISQEIERACAFLWRVWGVLFALVVGLWILL